jgi:hypothetical protein
MDHSHMDHGHMGHGDDGGDMDMGQCSMNVRSLLHSLLPDPNLDDTVYAPDP